MTYFDLNMCSLNNVNQCTCGYCIKGVCLAWLDPFVDNTKTKECGSTFKGLVDASDTSTERLIAMWGEPASVPTVQMLK